MQSGEERKENSINDYENLLITINDPMELKSELQKVYHESYRDYVECLLEKRMEESNTGHTASVSEGLVHAFTCLDNDMSREAQDPPKLNDDDQVCGLEHPLFLGLEEILGTSSTLPCRIVPPKVSLGPILVLPP